MKVAPGQILGKEERNRIHQESLAILERIGVLIPDEEVVRLLESRGACTKDGRILLPSDLVEESIQQSGKSFQLYGRDGNRSVTFAQGHFLFVTYQRTSYRKRKTREYTHLLDSSTEWKRKRHIDPLLEAFLLEEVTDTLLPESRKGNPQRGQRSYRES